MFFKIFLKISQYLELKRDSNTYVFLYKAATRRCSLKKCSNLQADVIDFHLKMLG